ncbi:DUF819 family protein [Luteimonas fraxinea]|uniref:DUF819 family protein n=1 Tax=Luteimonas fraxinea TaxID=2901869 RepID=A0ABS8UBK2_9GAMM|nr:DUF819 family protein [Luteimonas fraxinea]MCD9096257.1 DUF819 family protein [Luteimonas fraxinea]MCD9124770.1 DUF819 family protein [Luteimonas fraxinea]UHH10652.1 DUF819 family protein [Luteimonas fraxinea]
MAIETVTPSTALITSDIVLFGLIAATLGLIFWLASGPTPFWKKFFAWVPALLLCYFVPAFYNTVGLIDGEQNSLYNPIASRVLLPAALVLLTLSIDLKGILRLGPKLLFVFVAGTVGIVLGAIVSFQIMEWVHPPAVAGDTWKGMAALAGSWIGGGANMVAMREVYEVDATLFGQFAVVDVAMASLLMATLLFLANRSAQIDARSGADTAAIDEMKSRIAAHEAANARIPTLNDLMIIVAVAFGFVGLAHAIANPLSAWFGRFEWASRFSLDSSFVWVVLISTLAGLVLSFTKARRLEDAGASRIGTVFLYFLIACIGMQMDFMRLFDRLELIAIGAIWMLVHVLVIWGAARLVKAPMFYIGVGSMGNVGAAASAPVVAAAFHPTLAPVGVLLGTVGYATGTLIAYLVGQILRVMAGQ